MLSAVWLFLRGVSWQVYAGIVLVAALGFSHAWAYRKGEAERQADWDKAKVEAKEQQEIADEGARMKAQASALAYEKAKAAQVMRYVTVTKEVNHEIEVAPAWASERLPDGMRLAIAASQRLAASEPDSAVRVPDAGSADQRAAGPGVRPVSKQPGGLLGPSLGVSGSAP